MESGSTLRVMWKHDGMSTIFDNAIVFSSLKHESKVVHKIFPCDFCIPLFYTSRCGYFMYLRAMPYGCDIGEGKFFSIFLTLSPGNFDATVP